MFNEFIVQRLHHQLLAWKVIDVNEHERLSNFTLINTSKVKEDHFHYCSVLSNIWTFNFPLFIISVKYFIPFFYQTTQRF